MTWGTRAGKAWYWRGKGARLTDVVRAWALPIASVAVGGKFLGMQSRWAVLAAIGLAVIVESAAILIGWWEHRSGATEAEYRAALETDPFKVQSLELLTEIRDRLPAAR